jgi:adenylate cyclase
MRSRLPLWLLGVAVLCGALWAGWLGQGHLSGVASSLDRAETMLLDLRILTHGPRAAPDEVVIVAIDDATLSATGRYPVDRAQLAEIVEGIRDGGAKALAIDMLLIDQTNPEADDRLAKALGSLPTVIAAAGRFATGAQAASSVPRTVDVLRPLPLFAQSAAVGLVNIATDAGGTPRHMPLVFATQQGPTPALALRATGLFTGQDPSLAKDGIRVNGILKPLDLGWHLPLNYYGPAGTIGTVSARPLLKASGAAESDRPKLDGKLVFLGVTATAVGDRFSTPFDQVLPGVEVLATGTANLLDGSALIRSPEIRQLDVVAAVVLVVFGVAAFSLFPMAVASIIYLLLLASWLAFVTLAYSKGFWFSGALPLAASLPPVAAVAIVKQMFDRHQMRQLLAAREALGRFQAPALARRIAEDPEFLREPVELDAAILFIDLSGYTGLSERLGPGKTREFLKAFHTLVVDVSGRYNGLVLNFMGDGAMIGFGLPDARPDDAENAMRCAFALTREARAWFSGTGLSGEANTVRVGAHSGPVVLSRLGHEDQQQITVTGDCVNVASRLMEVGKGFEAAVTASATLTDAARLTFAELAPAPRIETVSIRGRQQAMVVGLWTAADIAALTQP